MSNSQGAQGLASGVGGRIRSIRESRGLSLSELARQAGLGKGTLSELESGRRNPTLETLYAVTGPLGIGLAELIGPPAAPQVAVHGESVTARLLDVLAGPGGTTEVYRLTIAPDRVRISPPHGPGVTERLHVVSGVALVGPVGAVVRVPAGSDHLWVSDTSHSFSADGPEPAVGVLLIVHPLSASH